MNDAKTVSELRAQADRNRYDFLKTDLALCFAFCDLAETELKSGDFESAATAFEKAEAEYLTIERLYSNLHQETQRQEIEEQLMKLRLRLDHFIPAPVARKL